ncbi:CDP-alcohol phosphatidyltransferase family protein [Nocardioides sp.]|uniref:CDP-alcohol phosphatidyltransferase family protein n=1 Tax=Nocardioides sp. TaxID=35761 RepID=UPI002ED82B9B
MSATTTGSRHDGAVRRGYRADLAALAAAQKPPRGTAAYSRSVNRPAARRVAAAVHQVGMTPDVATAVSATLSAAGLAVVALVRPSWASGLTVAVLLALGYVMDSVDGQLARLRGRGSVSGEWLDHTVDCVKTCAVHLAVLISFYRFAPVSSEAVLLLPIAYLVVDVTCFFGIVLLPHLRSPVAPETVPRPEGPWRRWLILPNDYGTQCWMFVLLGWGAAFVAAYAVMLAANAGLLALACRKWWRELRALDAIAAR